MKKLLVLLIIVAVAVVLVGCASDADVASQNISRAADQFQVSRRIIFYNGFTDTYMQTIEGKCSINVDGPDGQLEVTCKVGDERYLKHYLGLADNISYFVEQLESIPTDTYHYKVVFRPETIVPDVELDLSK